MSRAVSRPRSARAESTARRPSATSASTTGNSVSRPIGRNGCGPPGATGRPGLVASGPRRGSAVAHWPAKSPWREATTNRACGRGAADGIMPKVLFRPAGQVSGRTPGIRAVFSMSSSSLVFSSPSTSRIGGPFLGVRASGRAADGARHKRLCEFIGHPASGRRESCRVARAAEQRQRQERFFQPPVRLRTRAAEVSGGSPALGCHGGTPDRPVRQRRRRTGGRAFRYPGHGDGLGNRARHPPAAAPRAPAWPPRLIW